MLLFLIANILFVLSTSLTLIVGIILSILWLSISNFNYIQNSFFSKKYYFLSLTIITITLSLYNLSSGCQERIAQIMNIIFIEYLTSEILSQEEETKEEETKEEETKEEETKQAAIRKSNKRNSIVYLNHLNVALYSLINKPLGYGLNNYEVAFEIYKKILKLKNLRETPC